MTDDITPELLAELDQRRAGADEARAKGTKLRCGCTRFEGRVALRRWNCPWHSNYFWRMPFVHPIASFRARRECARELQEAKEARNA